MTWNVNWSTADVDEVPPRVMATMWTVPAAEAGATAVMEVSELMVNERAFTDPNLTAETVLKPVPVMVTLVPPPVEPVFGLTAVTVGAFW
jgi:hypothetical protein